MESDLSGNVTSEYIFVNGTRIARRDVSTGNVYYYFQDMLGSSNVVATSSGALENESDFYPFGGENVITQNLSNQKFKFTGKERDPETGLDDFGARYFNSITGRFQSPDWANSVEPIPYSKLDNPQTLNLYSYVGNNPVSGVDADGHQGPIACSDLTACGGGAQPDGLDAYQTDAGVAQRLFVTGQSVADKFNEVDASVNSLFASFAATLAQQQSGSTTATGDPIQNDLQKDVPGVSTVTPQPDPNLDKPHGGHQNETFALTFKTPKEQAAFLKESGRTGLLHKDNGFGPGVRLDGGLHAEHGRLDPTNPGAILVTSHIDRFNPNNGLGPMIGHFVVDVAIGSTFCSSSACLDH